MYYNENIQSRGLLQGSSEKGSQERTGSQEWKGMPTPTQLLQPPKPWTDELEDPKVNAPPPDPKPENPPLWLPNPADCWDSDPKVGAF